MANLRYGDECCGCSACYAVCPVSAISMQPDGMGFLYPVINPILCVECGMCEKVCSFSSRESTSQDDRWPKAYAARHVDIQEVNTSRSGASFVALSDYILDQKGVVYGAGFKGRFVVTHKCAVDKEQRQEFKGSKYVQSDMRDALVSLKEDLISGKHVCFSGTPCQIAAVRSLIPAKYHERLYLIDIVCHGVASPEVWQSYMTYIEKKYRGRIEALNFRDKIRFGWKDHRETFIVRGKPRSLKKTFYQEIYLRPSCSNCCYTNLNRPSDITIADFWGIEKVAPEFNQDDKGCNLLIVNTPKGLEWLGKVECKLDVKEVRIEDSLQYNLQYPTERHPLSSDFASDYHRFGFSYAMKKYCGWGAWNRTKRFLNRVISKILG